VTDREGRFGATLTGSRSCSLKSRPSGEGDARVHLARGGCERTGRDGWLPSIIGTPGGPITHGRTNGARERCVGGTRQQSTTCAEPAAGWLDVAEIGRGNGRCDGLRVARSALCVRCPTCTRSSWQVA